VKKFIFENASGSTRVEYRVDMTDNADRFTVMQVSGLSEVEAVTFKFRELDYDVVDFEDFAETNNFQLTLQHSEDVGDSEVLVTIDESSESE